MQARANRTVICSVVFLDIIEYSRKPVAEQIQAKERLNELLSNALADVAVNDRIILDTGDGAALSFLGDPEDALFVSLSLREALAAPRASDTPELPLRIGINLGPVKLITDLNGRPNIIGDGINVAQRVMGFAERGQILVSRSYYEVVSCLSDGYDKLFKYEGARTDKHVREHEVYAVSSGPSAVRRAGAGKPTRAAGSSAEILDKLAQTATRVRRRLHRKPRVATAIAVVAVLVTAVLIRAMLPHRAPEPVAAVPEETPSAMASAPETTLPEPPAERTAPAAEAKPAPPPAPATKTETRVAPPRPKSPPVETKLAAPPPPVITPPEPAPVEPATVTIAISPWGEVYVDDRMHGVAPPLREIKLPPGQHKIEIRNADFTPYVQTIEAQAGAKVRIRHKFR